MIIGKEFVWGHFGKTGGDSVRNMFRCVPKKEILFADPNSSRKKHRRFSDIERDLGVDLGVGKKKIMNIRRLSSWALSFANHMNYTYNIPIDKEIMINGMVMRKEVWRDPDHVDILPVKQEKIDHILEKFMSGNIDHWLRTENLADDFIKLFSNFFHISFLQRSIIRRTRSNRCKYYPFNRRDFFSKDEIAEMYRNCPLWASIEKKIYGNLAVDVS